MPQRKILLSVGGNNYRPPLERSKSAPRLMAIEEAIGEEDEDDTNSSKPKPEPRSCCTVDPLYPAMTLGRRRCKRGHSIRRTGNRHKVSINCDPMAAVNKQAIGDNPCTSSTITATKDTKLINSIRETGEHIENGPSAISDSYDDLDKLLLCNNYDTKSPLAGELMPYLDLKFKTKTLSLVDLQDSDDKYDIRPHLNSIRNSISLDDLDQFTDHGEDDDDEDDDDNVARQFFNQDHILDILTQDVKSLEQIQQNNNDNYHHRDSHRIKSDSTTTEEDDDRSSQENNPSNVMLSMTTSLLPILDSDEGSISSGCETASTVTANLEETADNKLDLEKSLDSLKVHDNNVIIENTVAALRQALCNNLQGNLKSNSSNIKKNQDSCDSDELSDESGYDEYPNKECGSRLKSILV